MSIKALSSETSRKLKSSLIIASPEVLVKELVENSIDADATSIEVLISANTIDRIQVRDNGTGINQDDFDVLGRRSHTSKLTSFSELVHKGGTTFGFRGEALASANTYGSVTITTRTKADKLASTISLVPKLGGVALCKPTSGVFGTTVAVTRLFKDMPVRKQQFTKCAPRTLSKIKEVLLRIIMARPNLKIVFKIPTNQVPTLSYTTSISPSCRDAVLQVLGRDLASECLPVTLQDGNFLIDAFLPTRCARTAIISGHGCFMAVDSRPLDPNRGTMRKILQMFRAFVGKAVGNVRTPFMQFDLRTPPASYDVNVDIGKTEVLFVNEPFVLNLFERLFMQVYEAPVVDPADSDEVMLDTDEVIPECSIPETPPSKNNQLPTPESNRARHFDTNPTINSESSASDVPQSHASLTQVGMSSTPPTSMLNTDTLSDIDTKCDMSECPLFEIMNVQTSWEVNMVFVGDSDEVPPPPASQQIEVQVIDNPVTSSFSEQLQRPLNQSSLGSAVNPWTLSQRRERTSPTMGVPAEAQIASSPGPGHRMLETVCPPDSDVFDNDLSPLRPGDLDVSRNQRDLSVVEDGMNQNQSAGRMKLPIRSAGDSRDGTSTHQTRPYSSFQERISNTPESLAAQRPFTRLTIDSNRFAVPQTPSKNPRSAPKNESTTPPQPGLSPSNRGQALRQTQISFPSRGVAVAAESVDSYGMHGLVDSPAQKRFPGPGTGAGKRQIDSFLEDRDDSPEQAMYCNNIGEGPSACRDRYRKRHRFMDEEDPDIDICDVPPAVHRRVLVPRGRQQEDSCARPVHLRQDAPPTRSVSAVSRARTRTRTISRDIRHLPLESVPAGQEIQGLVLEASVTVDRVRAGHVTGARYDVYAQAGGEGETLAGMELSEIDLAELENRVRQTLGAWGDTETGQKFSESISLGRLKGKDK